jgi:hypothetical protein
LTALPPPPPTPMTLMRANDSSAIRNSILSPPFYLPTG